MTVPFFVYAQSEQKENEITISYSNWENTKLIDKGLLYFEKDGEIISSELDDA